MNRLRPTQVQENFITYFRLFAGLPGMTFVESPVTWATSPEGASTCMILGAKLTHDGTDQLIDDTLTQIGQHSNAVDWFVFPSCQPDDLGEQLRKRGESGGPNGEWMLYGDIGGPGGNWMWVDLNKLAEPPTVPNGFQVKRVTNQAMLNEWAEINARGFGSDDYSSFHAAYSRHGFRPDAQAIHFIGYLEDVPVTSSTLLMAGGSASVYNVSTPRELRRQGFGGAITHAALQCAIEAGYQETWIWSSNLGKSVYAKLGFTMTDFGIREYQWKKKNA